MQLDLYNFSKRKNSTKQPSGIHTSVEVTLKRPTNISNPVFVVTGMNTISEAVNYAVWENRYYFVDNASYINNDNLEIECSIDVLATYKSLIHNLTTMVMYAEVNNTEITDSRIPTKTTASYQVSTTSFDTLGSGGYSIVLNTVGQNKCASFGVSEETASSIMNSVKTWYEDPSKSDIPQPSGSILGDVAQNTKYIAELVYNLFKNLFATGSASEGICSAFAIPLPITSLGGYTSEIYLGNFATGVQGQKITDRIFSDGCEVSIPWQATDWRRNAPYHEIYLYIPYVGLVNISPSDVMGYNSLHVSCNIDKTNGDSIFYVWVGNNRHVIGQYSTNIGSSFAIGNSNVSPSQTATSLMSAAGGVAGLLAGVTGVGAVASIGAVGLGLANSINGQPTTISSNGGGATLGLYGAVGCYTVFHDTIVAPSNYTTVQGQPVSKVMSLSTLNGYIQCSGASIDIPAHSDERDKVNDLLNTGFYYE